MEIHESAENYLEAILALSEKGSVRSIDVAQHLGFSKPSVSRAMSLLRDNGYVVMDENSFLVLTPAGREIAETIYERIEHDLSPETFQALKNHIAQHGDKMQ